MEIISRFRKTLAVGRAIAGACVRGIGHRSSAPTYLDVGARGGLPAKWRLVRAAGLIHPVFVEADAVEAERLRARYPGATVLPFALGDVDGEAAELKIAREPGRSSLLEPDLDVLQEFGPEPWQVVKRVPVALRRLDKVWPAGVAPPEFVKLDVQGCELKVLGGFGDLLEHVRCIELEVALLPLYRSQPRLDEIVDFLRAAGFGLVRLASMGLYGNREMIEFNAFWVRNGQQRADPVRMWKQVNGVASLRRLIVWGH